MKFDWLNNNESLFFSYQISCNIRFFVFDIILRKVYTHVKCFFKPDLPFQFAELREELSIAQQKIEALAKEAETSELDRQVLRTQLTKLYEYINKYETAATKTINMQDEVIELFKDIVETGKLLGGLLSISERDIIREEVEKTKKMFNLGLREKNVTDLKSKFDSMLFTKLVENLHRECPTITNILEQLVLSFNASRNTKKTVDMKMKASVHLLASLMDVRDQRAGNDIPVLFGFLCLCYGAGPSAIAVFQHLGLSESFKVL
jgi:septal ring factor EnvC (AmiA/AmiB activator)